MRVRSYFVWTIAGVLAAMLLVRVVQHYQAKAKEFKESTPTTTVIEGADPPYAIGFIGDSITRIAGKNGSAAEVFGRHLAHSGRKTIVVNAAVSYSSTGQWLPGGDYLTRALQMFESHHITLVMIMLGTNDAVLDKTSPLTYGQHIKTLCVYLRQHGYTPCINRPPYPLGNTQAQSLMAKYWQHAQSIAHEHQCVIGDEKAYQEFLGNKELTFDGIHPNTRGMEIMGKRWFEAFQTSLAHSSEVLPNKRRTALNLPL